MCRSTSAPAAARVSAAGLLLERGWGKAPQDVAVDASLTVTIRKLIDDGSDGAGVLIDVTPKKLDDASEE